MPASRHPQKPYYVYTIAFAALAPKIFYFMLFTRSGRRVAAGLCAAVLDV